MANVISICGSLRKGSYNRMVMNLLSELAPSEMIIKEAPSFAEFPLYNADIQNSTGFPDAVITLADAIHAINPLPGPGRVGKNHGRPAEHHAQRRLRSPSTTS